MLLIDALEERHDEVRLVENGSSSIEAKYEDGKWWLKIDGALYPLTKGAFDALMNLLRIPIKYIQRCVDEDGVFLAESSINYWLSKNDFFSFLVGMQDGEPAITQVFPGSRLYIPGVKVNDFIFEYLGDAQVHSFSVKEDVFNAVYITDKSVDVGNNKYHYGVRVLYSDCFKITPRFDGVLVSLEKDGATLAYPTTKRKFRVAGSTITGVFDQIEEFLDLSLGGLSDKLVPAFQEMSGDSTLISVESFVGQLCAELRLSRKANSEIESAFKYLNYPLVEMVEIVCAWAAGHDNSVVDMESARDVQIAACNYVIERKFK